MIFIFWNSTEVDYYQLMSFLLPFLSLLILPFFLVLFRRHLFTYA